MDIGGTLFFVNQYAYGWFISLTGIAAGRMLRINQLHKNVFGRRRR
jgi:hypothetical protein